MQFRRVIDNPEGICILHNDPGIAQNLEITEQKSELTITNLIVHGFAFFAIYRPILIPWFWILLINVQFLKGRVKSM